MADASVTAHGLLAVEPSASAMRLLAVSFFSLSLSFDESLPVGATPVRFSISSRAALRRSSWTSQMPRIWMSLRRTSAPRCAVPCFPGPISPSVMRSLGGVPLEPAAAPSTDDLTIIGPAAAAAAVYLRNRRRDGRVRLAMGTLQWGSRGVQGTKIRLWCEEESVGPTRIESAREHDPTPFDSRPVRDRH